MLTTYCRSQHAVQTHGSSDLNYHGTLTSCFWGTISKFWWTCEQRVVIIKVQNYIMHCQSDLTKSGRSFQNVPECSRKVLNISSTPVSTLAVLLFVCPSCLGKYQKRNSIFIHTQQLASSLCTILSNWKISLIHKMQHWQVWFWQDE